MPSEGLPSFTYKQRHFISNLGSGRFLTGTSREEINRAIGFLAELKDMVGNLLNDGFNDVHKASFASRMNKDSHYYFKMWSRVSKPSRNIS